MIIELVGLPGVGKSFLCRSLHDVYSDSEDVRVVVEREGKAFRALPGKLWRAFRFATTHVGTTGRLVRALGANDSILRKGRPSKFVNLLSETDRSARVAPVEVMISEQGVLQAIWSLEMRSDEPVHAELLAVLARWLPDRVVVVGSEREVYEPRLRQRENGRSHFDRLEPDELPEAIARGLRHMHEILDVWTLHVHEPDRLDFRNDVGAHVEEIVDWVGDPGHPDRPRTREVGAR